MIVPSEVFPMLRFGDVSTKLSEVNHIFHETGVAGLANYLRWRCDFHLKMLIARQIRSVTLDGCQVNMRHVPNSKTKLDLMFKIYEVEERRLVSKHVDPRLPVVELGGCLGVVACITNKILENPKLHVVVEANPLAIPLLAEIRDSNQCKFEILNAAVAYGAPTVTFRPTLDLCANSLYQKDGKEALVTVSATCLRDIVTNRNFDSFNLICDIEGSEFDLVCNEPEVVRKAATIILETHARFIGEAKNSQLFARLEDLGFRAVAREGTVVVLTHRSASDLLTTVAA